jgi:hypothetical protein
MQNATRRAKRQSAIPELKLRKAKATAGPSTPFGAKNAQNSAQDDSFMVVQAFFQNHSRSKRKSHIRRKILAGCGFY